MIEQLKKEMVEMRSEVALVKAEHEALKKQNQYEDIDEEKRYRIKISQLIMRLGVPPHIKGYTCLQRAIYKKVIDPERYNQVTKTIYPEVAIDCNTTAARVERAIRHAIEISYGRRGDKELFKEIFGYECIQKFKPTNMEYISAIAEYISNNQM